jgi:hypothetical protein
MLQTTDRTSFAHDSATRVMIVTPPAPKTQERKRGRIADIVSAIQSEKAEFYLADYVTKFPPATVQGIFSIAKALGYIVSVSGQYRDHNGSTRVARGKYVRRDVFDSQRVDVLTKENADLRAQLAAALAITR